MSHLTPSIFPSTNSHLSGTSTPPTTISRSITPLPPTALSSRSLPKILCLHGGGTNKRIFQIQTTRLQRLLGSEFEFVFAEGPFEGPAGPGVLPTFEGCGPFFRWTRVDRTDLPGESRGVLGGVLGVRRGVEEGVEEDGMEGDERDLEKGEIIAVLGFSQGAKVAAGMLLEQQRYLDQARAQTMPKSSTSSSERHAFNWNLKFAVLMNGGGPPATTGVDDVDGEEERVWDTPSVHVLGRQDPYLENGRKLFERWFEGPGGEDEVKTKKGKKEEGQDREGRGERRKKRGKAVLLEFDVGHRLPMEAKDNERVAGEIRRLWRESRGAERGLEIGSNLR